MSSPKPYGGTSSSRLTALINSINGRNRVEGVDFTYGTPQAVVGPSGENTRVTLTPVPGTYYNGPVDVHYTRLSIALMDNLPPEFVRPAVINQFPFTIRNVLTEINAALGLDLLPEEVVNTYYSSVQASYAIEIAPGSKAWLPGTTFTFAAEINRDITYILNTVFDGFDLRPGNIGEIITAVRVDGFNLLSRDINTVLDTSAVRDGFNRVPVTLSFVITQNAFDGFNSVPRNIATLMPNAVVDGFDLTPTDLAFIFPDALDGFDRKDRSISTMIPTVQDGFDYQTVALSVMIPTTVFDGFDKVIPNLSTVIATVLGGFDRKVRDISDPGVIATVQDGFDLRPGDLATRITRTAFDGFDLTPRNISTMLNTVIDGFDSLPSDLNAIITLTAFDGFDRGTRALNTIITSAAVDGFDAEPDTGDFLGDIVTVTQLDGLYFGNDLSELITTTELDGLIFGESLPDQVTVTELDGLEI